MRKGIDYETVIAATSGDPLAVAFVLDCFSDLVDGLCTGCYADSEGFWCHGIDVEMRSHIQTKLIAAMLRFEP